MLSPPEKTHWIPKPGNPNFLIQIGSNGTQEDPPPPPKEKEEMEEEEEPEVVEEEPLKKPKISKGVSPTEFEYLASERLYDALQPLYQFIGMLEAESGKPVYYRYLPGATRHDKMIPINFGANSKEEFLFLNPHFSEKMVNGLFSHVKKEPPASGTYSVQRVKLEAALIGMDYNIDNFPVLWPDWFRAQMGMPVFRFLISSTSLGAMELAANELGWPLKDLVFSPHVNYMFAQFCAKKFVSPKNNAYAGDMRGGQTTYRISSGFNTTQMANTKWIMGCKLWFKECYYAQNPMKMPDIDNKIAEAKLEINRLRLMSQTRERKMEIEKQKQRLKRLQAEKDSYEEKILKHD